MNTQDRETGLKLDIQFNEQGLVPALVQEAESGQVLMVAWMNEAALRQTLQTGKATFFSRSRQKMWVKGESSGHVMQVLEVRVDCDQDALLLRCQARGPACHAGYQSCFYRRLGADGSLELAEQRAFDPDKVYGR